MPAPDRPLSPRARLLGLLALERLAGRLLVGPRQRVVDRLLLGRLGRRVLGLLHGVLPSARVRRAPTRSGVDAALGLVGTGPAAGPSVGAGRRRERARCAP